MYGRQSESSSTKPIGQINAIAERVDAALDDFSEPSSCFTHTQFIVTTYVLAMLWMLVFALSALPVYFLYNMDATCRTIDVLTETPASINQLCVDVRQYGTIRTGSCLDWSSNTFLGVVGHLLDSASLGFARWKIS